MRESFALVVFFALFVLLLVLDTLSAASRSWSTLVEPARLQSYRDSAWTNGARSRDYDNRGVTRTDPATTEARGYKRRVLPYTRVDEILIPEISDDSKVCDDFDALDPAHRTLVRCDVTEGETACFRCIESRRYKRVCVHFDRDVTIYRSADQDSTLYDVPIVIPANSTVNEGYCLPRNFVDANPPSSGERSCNAYTGQWILARLQTSESESYNWICRCRYPQLMTNLTTVLSDCLLDVGCGGHGHLDAISAAGRQDPYVSGSCVCEEGWTSGFTTGVGPVCNVASLRDSPADSSAMINRLVGSNTFGTLRSNDPRVSPRFSQFFTDPILIADPCLIDSVTGEQLPDSPYVLKTVVVAPNDKWHDEKYVPPKAGSVTAAMCVPNDEYASLPGRTLIGTFSAYIGTLAESDYLLNNGGRWCNGVTRIANRDYPYTGTIIDRARYSLFTYQYDAHPDSDLPDAGVLLNRAYSAHASKIRSVQSGSSYLQKIYASEKARPTGLDLTPFNTKNLTPYQSSLYVTFYDPHVINVPTARQSLVCVSKGTPYRIFWLDDNAAYYGVDDVHNDEYTNAWIVDVHRYLQSVNNGNRLDDFQTNGIYERVYTDTEIGGNVPNRRIANPRYVDYLRCAGQALDALPWHFPGCSLVHVPGSSINVEAYQKTVKFISPLVQCGRLRVANCNNWDYDGSVQVSPVDLSPTIGTGELYLFVNRFLYGRADKNYPRKTCYQKDLAVPTLPKTQKKTPSTTTITEIK